jgi:hypothetical protein
MNTNMFALASALSDHDLLARLGVLAVSEREATAELVAHLAALDARPSLYAARGHGSLFGYCTHVLGLSEDATCNRIAAARACRRFPSILAGLASGALSLSAIRKLGPCLTQENHETILARASGRSCREIDALVAELAPQPDAPTSVRKLPTPVPAPPLFMAPPEDIPTPVLAAAAYTPPARRAVIETTSPQRYRVQFTIGKESHDTLRRLQALLRREIPNGDAGAIVERALRLLLEKVEKAKFAATSRPRTPRRIRPAADASPLPNEARTPILDSRDIPAGVQRAAWRHDGGQCGFVSTAGHRCRERSFLEFHHLTPYARGGPTTADNIALRCRRHNQYEAERVFGPRPSPARKSGPERMARQ